MVEPVTKNTPNDNTAHESDVATVDRSIAGMAWRKVVIAEQQLQLMRKLHKLKLGTADVQ